MTQDKQHNRPNVPPLRFPEFTEPWETAKLGAIAEFSKGTGISKEQRSETGLPCILYGELYTTYTNEVIEDVVSKTDLDPTDLVKSQKNDVIIPSSGETAEDIATARCVTSDNVLLGGDLNIIRLVEPNDGRFMSYQLNGIRKYDIAKIAQGVSVVHLYGGDLKMLSVTFPQSPEQKKIADCISLLDRRISVQSGLIEDLQKLKAALYQKVFSSIPGEEVALSNLAKIIKGKQINGTELFDSGNYYVMNGGTLPSGFYNEYNTPANTISISEGGNSCGYVQFNNVPFWSGGHCYTLQITSKQIHLSYLYHYLKHREQVIMELRIGSGLPNIQKKDLERFPILMPTIEVQQRLSRIFDSLQRKEEVEKSILNRCLSQKQYLLQKMFI